MTSVGIIGGGIAGGLTAALSLAKLGYEVTLIHTGINTTNSYLAQAGIAFPPLLEGGFNNCSRDRHNERRKIHQR